MKHQINEHNQYHVYGTYLKSITKAMCSKLPIIIRDRIEFFHKFWWFDRNKCIRKLGWNWFKLTAVSILKLHKEKCGGENYSCTIMKHQNVQNWIHFKKIIASTCAHIEILSAQCSSATYTEIKLLNIKIKWFTWLKYINSFWVTN